MEMRAPVETSSGFGAMARNYGQSLGIAGSGLGFRSRCWYRSAGPHQMLVNSSLLNFRRSRESCCGTANNLLANLQGKRYFVTHNVSMSPPVLPLSFDRIHGHPFVANATQTLPDDVTTHLPPSLYWQIKKSLRFRIHTMGVLFVVPVNTLFSPCSLLRESQYTL